MPKLTNRHNLPVAFERFEAADPYSKGDADYSVTELIDAPQIAALKQEHDHEMEEDVSDRIMSILGTAIHSILQHGAGPDDVPEERFYAEVSGKRISGQCDLLTPTGQSATGEVSWGLKDYKTTRGMSIVYNPDGGDSWIQQVNCYAYLAEVNGYCVTEGSVIAIIRDWTASLLRRNHNFPRQPVIEIPVEIWPFEERLEFIEERIRLHELAKTPDCTDKERWKGRDVYAVIKYRQDGGLMARADKLFDTYTEAMIHIETNDLNAEIQHRVGEPTRCEGNYCQVAQFCPQYQKERSF